MNLPAKSGLFLESMLFGRALAAVAIVLAVAGCATPPVSPAKTTVVLLPDEDGNVGAVVVGSAGGSQRVDEAYAATVVQGGRASALDRIGQARVGQAYSNVLDAQPPKPKIFVLNFLLNKTVLTDESKAQIATVMETIRARKPTEITVFGHADATGTEEHNLKLSAERARVVAALLRKHDPSLDHIDVQWFGATAPLVKSEPHKVEVRNRRAEIQVL